MQSVTGAFSAVMSPLPVSWGEGYNRFTHHFFDYARHLGFWGHMSFFRKKLGLPPMSPWKMPYRHIDGHFMPTLYAYSPHLIPRPADWRDDVHVTGYWFLDDGTDWDPPADLVDFLESGPPPVYVGFGSLSDQDFDELSDLVLAAIKKSGLRGLLLTGWGGLANSDLPDEVFKIDSAPHDWLFPQMAAVVHHGGAGTTAAGLRAGVPSVLVPFFGDQPFWGRWIAKRGVGTQPLLRSQLTADKLAYAIKTAANHPGIKQRAAEIGERIRAEDGIGYAVRIIDSVLRGDSVYRDTHSPFSRPSQ